MKRELGMAYCGLACCLCASQDGCPGCRAGGCARHEECKNYQCCRKRGLAGCWECLEFPCEGNILDKLKPRAFARFLREHEEEELLDCLERNERAGVVYHRPNSIMGEYDEAGSEEAVFQLLLHGGRTESR